MVLLIIFLILFILIFSALYYKYNTNNEHFDHFDYIFRRDFPRFVIKLDSKPKINKDVYLKLVNNTDGKKYYFRWLKYGYSNLDKKLFYGLSLSENKDIRNRFDLHLNDPEYLVPGYIKFFRNDTVNETFPIKHGLADIVFVTSLYNPNTDDFLELGQNDDGTLYLMTRVRNVCGDYSLVKINNNELNFDGYDEATNAKFILVDENDNKINF